MNAISIYGRVGDVFAQTGKNEDSQSHTGRKPKSLYGDVILAANGLTSMSDAELLEVAFGILSFSNYGSRIVKAFAGKTGNPLYHKMTTWFNFASNKGELTEAIRQKIIKNHDRFHFNGGLIDISDAVKANMPTFRKSILNLSEMIAIGGVQEVEIKGTIVNERQGYDFWDRNGDIFNSPHRVDIDFTILLKDWFGVDEDDFTNFRPAALVDRRGLAAMWVLQHQRGYKPFINIFEFRTIVTILLGRR